MLMPFPLFLRKLRMKGHDGTLLMLFVCAIPCSALAENRWTGPPLQLAGHESSPPAELPNLRLTIDPTPYQRSIRWWSVDPLPWQVRQAALHPKSHLLGFEDSNLVVTPVPLSTRAMNDLRVTSDPHTWFLLAFGYRTLF